MAATIRQPVIRFSSTTLVAAETLAVGKEIAAKGHQHSYFVPDGLGATVDEATGVVTLNAKDQEPHGSSAQARDAITEIDVAIKNVDTQQSSFSAVTNSLTYTEANLTNLSANPSLAKDGIEEADFVQENTNLAKILIFK